MIISGLQKKMLILVVSLAMFMELLDGTALNASLPQIASSLGELPVNLKLAITIYLFALGVLIPLSAYLVEKFGTKKVLFSAFVVFILGSIGCGLSQSLWQLITCRGIQGVGGAFMLPVGRLAIARIFGKDLIRAMTIVTSISLVGPMIGPVLGGFITSYLNWHWIFFINIPISLVALLCIYRYFPKEECVSDWQFDFVGFVLLFLGLSCILISSDHIGEGGSSNVLNVGVLFIGLMILASYIPYSKRIAQPIMDIAVFDNKNFFSIAMGNFLVRFAVGALPFIVPVFLHQKFNLNAFHIGLSLLPFVFGTWLAKPFIVRILSLTSIKNILVINTFLLAVFQLSLLLFVLHWNVGLFILYGMLVGFLNSIQFASMNSTMFFTLSDKDKAHGNAIYLSMSQLGGCFGVSIVALILSAMSGDYERSNVAFEYAIGFLGGVTLLSIVAFRLYKPKSVV